METDHIYREAAFAIKKALSNRTDGFDTLANECLKTAAHKVRFVDGPLYQWITSVIKGEN